MTRITVTQPLLPPLAEFAPLLERIWDSRILTNAGPLHEELEHALCARLGVPYLSLFANATIALMTAVQVLGLEGDVITTPFSFVAGAHALRRQHVHPVFVDVDPQTLNIDPARVEAAITPRTTGILAVHCYGTPCDTAALHCIADRHGLQLLYDAAHAFGITVGGESVLRQGHLSVLSFHATKVFSTFEGGAIVSHDAATKARIDRLRNFGITDEVTVDEVGLNGKMSEIHAAFGLLQLRYIDAAIVRRAQIAEQYQVALGELPGIDQLPTGSQDAPNHSYFPVRVRAPYPLSRDALYDAFRQQGIYARRYFYPLISDLGAYRAFAPAEPDALPVAAAAAREILCLPMHPGLTDADVTAVLAVMQRGATAMPQR